LNRKEKPSMKNIIKNLVEYFGKYGHLINEWKFL